MLGSIRDIDIPNVQNYSQVIVLRLCQGFVNYVIYITTLLLVNKTCKTSVSFTISHKSGSADVLYCMYL